MDMINLIEYEFTDRDIIINIMVTNGYFDTHMYFSVKENTLNTIDFADISKIITIRKFLESKYSFKNIHVR